MNNKELKNILEEYGLKNFPSFEDFTYEINRFADGISRVKIVPGKENVKFSCPVYAMFDGYNMAWYGDYGFWGFNCTWETDISNLPYNNPYYLLEKLRSREPKEFDAETCKKELLKHICEGEFYQELTKEQQTRFNEYINEPFSYILSDDILDEYEDTCEALYDLYHTADSEERDYISAVDAIDRLISLNDIPYDAYSLFGCECYELYNIGHIAPIRFFIILYLLSIVYEREKEKAIVVDENDDSLIRATFPLAQHSEVFDILITEMGMDSEMFLADDVIEIPNNRLKEVIERLKIQDIILLPKEN